MVQFGLACGMAIQVVVVLIRYVALHVQNFILFIALPLRPLTLSVMHGLLTA